MNLPTAPFRIHAAAVLALVFGGSQIVEVIALELFTDRYKFQHHTIIFDSFLASVSFLVLAYGIWHRRRWAWWLGIIVLGVPALTFPAELAFSGNIDGFIWLGHSVTDSWVTWVTSIIGHPACLIAALILATHFEDFDSVSPPEARFPRS